MNVPKFNNNRIGFRRLKFPSVDSTNTVAASHASDPANHGLVITAEAQSAGRGQYERTWHASAGSSILMSVLLFPDAPLRRPSLLTAWAAVGVCETIRQAVSLQAQIKWPNDILIGGKKVCGILCEAGAHHLVVGIGLNVRQSAADFERLGLPNATSLAICAGGFAAVGILELTDRLIQVLDESYAELTRGNFLSLENGWKSRIGLVGTVVCAKRMDGGDVRGRLLNIAFDGVTLEIDDKLTVAPPEAIRHLTPSLGQEKPAHDLFLDLP